ncbi:MAG: hypothetical protein HWE37_08500 [Rhodobacteraceae bacterium]|nr:hypothetical protein [Paracoccaceae bacterium]
MVDLVTQALVLLVEHHLTVDPAHRMVLGQSFGGAFALEARMRQAGGSRVAAGSASIWSDFDPGASLPSVLCRAVAFLWLAAASAADQSRRWRVRAPAAAPPGPSAAPAGSRAPASWRRPAWRPCRC